jgi:hypothetical protein
MTIIAAMWETDTSILIAADSCVTEMPEEVRSLDFQKLDSHPSAPIAWGISGNPTIGERFGKWLKSYNWPLQDLSVFQDDVATHLSELNGKQRSIMALAGSQPGENDLSDVLVVGFLATPFSFVVDERGLITTYKQSDRFHAIGSGKTHASLISFALSTINVSISKAELFNHIMTLASSKAKYCSPPISILRANSEGIEKVQIQQSKGQNA